MTEERESVSQVPVEDEINIAVGDVHEGIRKLHNWKALESDRLHNFW